MTSKTSRIENEGDHTILLKVDEVKSGKKVDRILGESIIHQTSDNKLIESQKFLVFLNKQDPKIEVEEGNKIWLRGQLNKITASDRLLDFNWADYYKRRGICYSMSNPLIGYSENESTFLPDIKGKTRRIKESILKIIEESTWSESTTQIVSAMILGDKSGMDNQLKQTFSTSGVIHVLAVSGLHVGIIFLFIRFICNLIGLKKKNFLYVFLILFSTWLFAAITGFSSSVSRASFMLSLIVIAESIGRRSSIYNTIACSAFFILLFEPSKLFDLGFQLSYSAVLGIISIYPLINSLFNFKNALVLRICQMMAVSISAQLATLPLILYHFGTFPLYFLVGNLIAIPATTIIVIASLIYILLYSIKSNHILIEILVKVIDFISCCFEEFMLIVSKLPQASQQIQFTELSAILCAAGISMITVSFYRYSKSLFFLGSLIISLLFVNQSIDAFFRMNERNVDLICVNNELYLSITQHSKHEVIQLEGERELKDDFHHNLYKRMKNITSSTNTILTELKANKLIVLKDQLKSYHIAVLSSIQNIPARILKEELHAVIVLDKEIGDISTKVNCPIYYKENRNFKSSNSMKFEASTIVVQDQDFVELINWL